MMPWTFPSIFSALPAQCVSFCAGKAEGEKATTEENTVANNVQWPDGQGGGGGGEEHRLDHGLLQVLLHLKIEVDVVPLVSVLKKIEDSFKPPSLFSEIMGDMLRGKAPLPKEITGHERFCYSVQFLEMIFVRVKMISILTINAMMISCGVIFNSKAKI